MSNPFDESGDAGGAGDDGFAELDQHALPFVTVDEQDRFHINPEAVRYLKTITGRVAVVAIAGAVKLADGTRRVRVGTLVASILATCHPADALSAVLSRARRSHRPLTPRATRPRACTARPRPRHDVPPTGAGRPPQASTARARATS